MSISNFDTIAADFDRFRALPPAVPTEIRNAVWTALGSTPGMRLLDVGAGTGRIGNAFVAAGDSYIAVESSAKMLSHFAEKAMAKVGPTPALVQADGQSLPFPAGSFDAVLMVQVVSGSSGWRRLLTEAGRVLRPEGAVILGQKIGPPEGLDARMRAQLSLILAQAGVDARRPGAGRDDVREWLALRARRITEVVAARWETTHSPIDFLNRHVTGARFATLPRPIREAALERLADWAVATFGALDATLAEPQTFMLDVAVL